MPDREFTCDHCGETYFSAWTEAEAEAEYELYFGDEMVPREERSTLCEDCWKAFQSWVKKQ